MDSQFAPEEDFNNTVDSYNVTLNGFIFCTRHGLEVCDKCPTDNVSANNMMVEDMLHEKLTEDEYSSKWKGDDRAPFTVTHKWVRVSQGKPGCMSHKTVGCEECFNWGEQLYRGIHGGRKPRVSRVQRKSRKASTDERMA
ncbi:hypothetical protein K501DRAFT_262741 [Backusella circina FSU 941]|nr:hypothetical protein K501DRAFT_262739 [Backusella circina FSU 941]KAI8876091.1 hypothetical protein K501DRAFT_262741 [Backusella circina FSU 941]